MNYNCSLTPAGNIRIPSEAQWLWGHWHDSWQESTCLGVWSSAAHQMMWMEQNKRSSGW